MNKSLGADYFDALYAGKPDPWDFKTSAYEDAKYADTIAALDGRRYGRALEVGCSIGVLTRRLADVADQLIAIDIAAQPLAEARARNRGKPNVHFLKQAFPREAPDGPFDLIVLSEVLYYLAAPDLERAAQVVQADLAPGGEVLMVHWLGETPDYPLTGDQAAEGFIERAAPPLTIVRQTRRERYRLDLLRRAP